MDDDRRRFWRVLLLIALVALAVRVTYVFVEKRDGALTGDELFYNAEANYLADGHLFTEPFNPRFGEKGQGLLGTGPAADHPPLTVSFLTPISFVSDRSELAQRLDDDGGRVRDRPRASASSRSRSPGGAPAGSPRGSRPSIPTCS